MYGSYVLCIVLIQLIPIPGQSRGASRLGEVMFLVEFSFSCAPQHNSYVYVESANSIQFQ